MRKMGLPRSWMTTCVVLLLACAALVTGWERAGAQSSGIPNTKSGTSSTKSGTTSKSGTSTKSSTKSTAPKAETTPKAESTPSTTSGKPWLGVYSQDLDSDLREALELSGGGALVTRVVADSPAEKAGLKRRDYIVRFNGQTVGSADDLSRLVRDTRVDQTVSVDVMRDGAKKTLSLKVGSRPADFAENENPNWGWDKHEVVVPDMDGESFHMNMHDLDDIKDHARVFVQRISPRGRLGVRVEDVNSDLAPYFNLKDQKGALVVEVYDNSPAQKAGIKAGDVIVQIGNDTVSDTESLVRTLRDEEGDTKVTVVRKGQRMTLTPKLESPEPMGYRYRSAPMSPNERQQMQDEMRRMKDQLKEMQERLDKLEKD